MDFKLKTEQEGEFPVFVDERLLEALEQVVLGEGCAIYIGPNPRFDNHVMVQISYGAVERDEKAMDAFDTAEFGGGTSVEEALRYALGACYGSSEETYG